ncbi:MAG: repair protein RadC [Myxococcaceae bacterium]|nr:repair protein RadC [Myxococcaceae bacterium]
MESTRESAGAREKLSQQGIDALSDAELVALLLGTGTADAPVSVLAERLLLELGGLHKLARASVAQLAFVRGVGASKSARIAAGIELGRRVSSRPLERGARIASSEDVYRAFGPLLARQQHEELWAVALDARQRVITRVQLARGGLSACPISIADVFRPLIREGASAMIVIHNHPSGAPDPSPEDLAFTERVAQAGELLGIFLLDHVIVAADGYFSCLDAGLCSGSQSALLEQLPPGASGARRRRSDSPGAS